MANNRTLFLAIAVVVCINIYRVDAHGAQEDGDDKLCPLCRMSAKDDNWAWYVQLKNGQKIYTCGMTSGKDYARGRNSFSHPSLLGADMAEVSNGEQCENKCPECNDPTTPLLDPISGVKITTANFKYVCLSRGQKVYFASNDNKATYLNGIKSKPNFQVDKLVCNSQACPDSFQVPPTLTEKPTLPSTIPPPSSATQPGAANSNSSNSMAAFCSQYTVMFTGFQSSAHNKCIRYFFPSLDLNTWVKYMFGVFGAFLIALANEVLIFYRSKIRVTIDHDKIKYVKLYLLKCCLAILHMLQMTIAYFAMLVAMFYETWMFIALICGFGVGYFIFHNMDTVITESTWRFTDSRTITVLVNGMKCMKNCGSTVQKALEELRDVSEVYVEMDTKLVYILGGSISEIIETISDVGFDGTVVDEGSLGNRM